MMVTKVVARSENTAGQPKVIGGYSDNSVVQTKVVANHGDSNSGQAVAEVSRQLDALKSTTQVEIDGRKAWSTAMESKVEQMCNNIRRELQGSMKLALEAISMKVMEQVKKRDEAVVQVKERNEEMTAEMKELKANLAAQRKSLDDRKMGYHTSASSPERALGPGGARLEERVKRLNDMVQQLKVRDEAQGTAISTLEDKMHSGMVSTQAQLEELQAKQQTLKKAPQGRDQQPSEEVAELAELVKTFNNEYSKEISKMQQSLEAFDVRLRQTKVTSEDRLHVEKDASESKSGINGHSSLGNVREISNLRELIAAVTRRVDTLTSTVQDELGSGRSKQDVHDRIEKLNATIRREIENLRLEIAEQGRISKAATRATQEQQAILDKLEGFKPSELEAVKAGLEDHKVSVRNRISEVVGQIDVLAAAVREEPRLRCELGDRVERSVAGLEHKLRAEMQHSLDDVSHKHRDGLRDMKDTLHKLNSESMARRLTEVNELLDERVQSQLQTSQKKNQNALEEFKTSVERQTSHVRDSISQERASREAGEQRFHKKLDMAISSINSEQEALRHKIQRSSASEERQRSHTPPHKNNFNWEDEVRRLWEALDQHTHEVTCERKEEQQQSVSLLDDNTSPQSQVQTRTVYPNLGNVNAGSPHGTAFGYLNSEDDLTNSVHQLVEQSFSAGINESFNAGINERIERLERKAQGMNIGCQDVDFPVDLRENSGLPSARQHQPSTPAAQMKTGFQESATTKPVGQPYALPLQNLQIIRPVANVGSALSFSPPTPAPECRLPSHNSSQLFHVRSPEFNVRSPQGDQVAQYSAADVPSSIPSSVPTPLVIKACSPITPGPAKAGSPIAPGQRGASVDIPPAPVYRSPIMSTLGSPATMSRTIGT